MLPVRCPMVTVHSLAQVPSASIFFRKAFDKRHAVRALGQADSVRVLGTEGCTRQTRVAGSEAQGIEQQRVVGHVGFHASLAQGVDGFLVCLELLHDRLGRELRKDRRPCRSRLGRSLLAGEIVIGLDRLVVRLDQHPRLRGVVRPRERNLLRAGRGDGISGQHDVHLAIDENLFARGRGDLRELVLGRVAQDIAGEKLGQARVETADLAVLLVELREEVRRLRAAEAHSAGLLDLACPFARRDGRRVRDGAVCDQRVECCRIDGCTLCEKRSAGRHGQCRRRDLQNGCNRHDSRGWCGWRPRTGATCGNPQAWVAGYVAGQETSWALCPRKTSDSPPLLATHAVS